MARVSEPKQFTPEQERMFKRMRNFKLRYDKAMIRAANIEQQRTDLYLAARLTNPPITYQEIADVFGVTEAAVMQKVRRDEAARANGTKPAAPA